MCARPNTPLLDQISNLSDVRDLSDRHLVQLAQEVRAETISAVSETGGHLGAGLGVIELTVALHAVFDTPRDTLIWDVSHQSYPHKILTGRRDRIRTLRQGGGLSGFTKRNESPFDPFGAGHSSTSVSAALGFAVARDLQGETGDVIAVIGDGAMSAGMAYEALNHAGDLGRQLIVVLNDNSMSIAPPVGAMSHYLNRLAEGSPLDDLKSVADGALQLLPDAMQAGAKRASEKLRQAVKGDTLFDTLGFDYIGPVDGHDMDQLLPVLRGVKARSGRPVLVHVVTQKGKGFAEDRPDKGHATGKFDLGTGRPTGAFSNKPTYTSVFAEALLTHAAQDDRIVAVTAAMPDGTGVARFMERYPSRCFDVGIAEQHAVTFSAGLAAAGMKPFCAIYSTFLQRGYDQVVHDVAVQGLPVRFAIDRAGLVGADGPTHAGAFDIAFLANLPGFTVMAAADEAELARMVATAVDHDAGPIAFRFPRGSGVGTPVPDDVTPLEIGKGRVIRKGDRVALVSFGARLSEVLQAANVLEGDGIKPTVVDARFAKPLDRDLLLHLAETHEALLTIEEGAVGGFGSQVMQLFADAGIFDSGLKFRALTLPDRFIDQGTPDEMYGEAGLNAKQIFNRVIALLD